MVRKGEGEGAKEVIKRRSASKVSPSQNSKGGNTPCDWRSGLPLTNRALIV